MTWHELVRRIRTSGRYTTDAEAEDVLRAVLTVLGGHVIGEERCELVRLLPTGAGEILASRIPLTQPLTAPEFVEAVAAGLGSVPLPTARWGVGTVLGVLAETAGEELTGRILAGLPRGYALLFGRAELVPAA
ncbi:DUF2267 domain-containing protein [Streptomyces sp. I05A-00742]|uniref:DUF2267 domain-containing protein n=1 Tax=Streptomyces sp. I05A-00742 TaxID=2732853 RepID=UPI001487F17C|nr:DUF2267 domain-containing protein [Streptomyces sp. I05A-00742]